MYMDLLSLHAWDRKYVNESTCTVHVHATFGNLEIILIKIKECQI